MAEVWKFILPLQDEIEFMMPKGAEPLYVATQGETGCLWARVIPDNPKERRVFHLRGTGLSDSYWINFQMGTPPPTNWSGCVPPAVNYAQRSSACGPNSTERSTPVFRRGSS